MTLRDIMAADLAKIHGDSVAGPTIAGTYHPAVGDTIAVNPGFTRLGFGEENFPDGVYEVETGQIYLLVSEVATVTLADTIELPALDGSGNQTWNVRRVYFENAAIREIQITRQVRKRLVGEGDEHDRGRGAAGRRTGS